MKIENQKWELKPSVNGTEVRCPGNVVIDCWDGRESRFDAQERAKTIAQVPEMLNLVKTINSQLGDRGELGKISVFEFGLYEASKKILKELE